MGDGTFTAGVLGFVWAGARAFTAGIVEGVGVGCFQNQYTPASAAHSKTTMVTRRGRGLRGGGAEKIEARTTYSFTAAHRLKCVSTASAAKAMRISSVMMRA